MISIGHDPGRSNYAYSILDFKLVNDRPAAKLLRCGLLQSPIVGFKNLPKQVGDFTAEFLEIERSCSEQATVYSVERFQGRGIKSSLLETVNVAVGCGVLLFNNRNYQVNIYTPTAGTWKGAVNRVCDLKDWYKRIRCTPHELDATLIAMYGVYRYYEVTPFSTFTEGDMANLVAAVERTTTIPLVNRRYKRA